MDGKLNAIARVLDFSSPIRIEDRSSIVKFVAFLEDRKIRFYPVANRSRLRKNDKGWGAAYREYLVALECPHVKFLQENPVVCLYWLAMHAVGLDHEDNIESVGKSCEDFMSKKKEAKGTSPRNNYYYFISFSQIYTIG